MAYYRLEGDITIREEDGKSRVYMGHSQIGNVVNGKFRKVPSVIIWDNRVLLKAKSMAKKYVKPKPVVKPVRPVRQWRPIQEYTAPMPPRKKGFFEWLFGL